MLSAHGHENEKAVLGKFSRRFTAIIKIYDLHIDTHYSVMYRMSLMIKFIPVITSRFSSAQCCVKTYHDVLLNALTRYTFECKQTKSNATHSTEYDLLPTQVLQYLTMIFVGVCHATYHPDRHS